MRLFTIAKDGALTRYQEQNYEATHQEAQLEALLESSSASLPKVDNKQFLASLDQNGVNVFQKVFEFARQNGLRFRWGAKGFSLNLELVSGFVWLTVMDRYTMLKAIANLIKFLQIKMWLDYDTEADVLYLMRPGDNLALTVKRIAQK